MAVPGCIFCAIVEGSSDAAIVSRDDRVTAFMDIRPVRPGHVLVVPNEHQPNFEDLDVEVLAQVMRVSQRIAIVLKRLHSPEKIGLAVAGFDIAHAHFHVIPLHDYHDLTSKRLLDGLITRAGDDELAARAREIRMHLEAEGT